MSTLLHAPHGLRPGARRLARWLLLALLLGTLAPGISRTLAALSGTPPDARPGEHWVQLCSGTGMQWVRVELQGHESAPPTDSGSLDRCGHCTLAAERFAPMVPSLPLLPTFTGHRPMPAVAVWSVTDVPARTARARGPPLLD